MQDWCIFAWFSAFFCKFKQKCSNLVSFKWKILRIGLTDFGFLKACGHILNLSRVHNSCKQKFYITNCPKKVLFVQFQFLLTVYFPAWREISKCSPFSLVGKSFIPQKELLQLLNNKSGSTAKLQPYSSLFLDHEESKHQISFSLWLHFIRGRDQRRRNRAFSKVWISVTKMGVKIKKYFLFRL